MPLGMGVKFCNNGMLCTMKTADKRETILFSSNLDTAWTKPFDNLTGWIDLAIKDGFNSKSSLR